MRLSDVEIKILGSKFIEQGPLLVTHWGVSGPAVLKLSAWGARYLKEKNYEFDFMVNWLPEIKNEETLKDQLNKLKQEFGSKKIKSKGSKISAEETLTESDEEED